MLVVIIDDNSHKYLNRTISSLKHQSTNNFNVLLLDPFETNVKNGIKSPQKIIDQINFAVNFYNHDYYAIICSGCEANYKWVENFIHRSNIDYLSASVYLCSKNEPYEGFENEVYKYGQVDSIDNFNYNNFAFSRKSFEKIGGFKNNVRELNSLDGLFCDFNYVEKPIELNSPERDQFYRIISSIPRKKFQFKPVLESYSKNKPNLLVTIATGDFKEILFYTEESMFQYANKINADYLQITNKTQDYGVIEKYRLENICKNYDRIIFVDADIVIQNDPPNIFEIVPDGHIGIYNDWYENGDGTINTNDWIIKQSQEMCFYQDVEYIQSEVYNSGVVVFNGYQSDIWKPPSKPFLMNHCTEQHWVEQNIRRLKYPVYDLNKNWNNQWWSQEFENYKNDCYFLHFADHPNKHKAIFEYYDKQKPIKDGQQYSIKFKNIDFKKYNDNAIVVISSDNKKLLNITSASHRKYAKRVGADYHLVTDNINPDWPMANKYLLNNYTNVYDKTLYVDSDVFIRNNAPDIFKITPDDKISIHNEDYEVRCIEYGKHIQGVHNNICKNLDIEPGKAKSLNCGVMVIPKSCSYLYTYPKSPISAFWCFDQHYLTITLNEHNCDYFEIGEKFNWEYIRNDWHDKIYEAYFIHLNGLKSESKRIRLLENYFGE